MSTAKIIGKETAIARLVVWHKARIARAFPLFNPIEQEEKMNEVTGEKYRNASPRKIYKEYDEVFSAVPHSKWTLPA